MKKTILIHCFICSVLCWLASDIYAAEHPVFGQARWISTEQNQSATNTWLIYRKTVDLPTVPTTLIANIAADTKYWLWINDELVVFEGGLKRGPSRNGTYYDPVEIAPYLQKGENTIAILLWHFGKDGFSHTNSGKAWLLFAARSPEVEIVSDTSWSCAVYGAYQSTDGPHPNYRLPESNIRFNARRAREGWNKKDTEIHLPPAMAFAEAGKGPLGTLVERPIPLWKDYGLQPYAAIRKSVAQDTLFCRLPYNCHVTPWLEIEAPAGKTIHILTDNYRGGGTTNVRAEYITREGRQAYESYGWMNGHEVWYIIPEGVTVVDVKYRETGFDTEFTGAFSCNDPFYNELWRRSARTLYVTMRDTYMDCPDRERAQWWGDEVNELGEAFYALSPSSHSLAVKGIYELMNWQKPDGSLFSPMPAGNWDKELPLQMLASVGWYGFYTQYYYSADSSFVPVIYNRLRYYLHKVWRVDKSGLVIERPGAWSWGDWGEHVDMGVLTNCWYYLALKAEKEFAALLGKTDDVRQINRMMYSIENCFRTKFWTGTAYRSPGYKGETDDRAQAMAVLSGLATKDQYPALLKVFKKEYHASPYMEKYVLEALFEMDYADFALERMKERYTKMISYPYTTLFEGWDIGDQDFGHGTINHAWSGGPLTLLSQKVCGVHPTSPGFQTFRITPQMGTLDIVQAKIDTHYGFIEVHIEKKGKRLHIKATVPEGTEATVEFPSGRKRKLTAGSHEVAGI